MRVGSYTVHQINTQGSWFVVSFCGFVTSGFTRNFHDDFIVNRAILRLKQHSETYVDMNNKPTTKT